MPISHCKFLSLSLTYKLLNTSQPSYLYNLISLQPPRCIRSSSLVTLARPPTRSILKITDRSFRYASPHLWNQLPGSFCQPCLFLIHHSLPHNHISSPSSSPLSPSITPLFRSKHSFFINLFLYRPPDSSFTPSGLL